MTKAQITNSTNSSNLVDVIERVLDKGIVIAGDIKVSLVDIELLSIQIRLVICSVDRAVEMGMDWWKNGSSFLPENPAKNKELAQMSERLAALEKLLLSSQAISQLEKVGGQ